jgi:hypothetical protein
MGMIHVVTYSADNMSISRGLCSKSSLENGADRTYPYHANNDIGVSFKNFNSYILSARRGFGYWLQKPYFINMVMGYLSEGDYLIYVDAGSKIIRPFQLVIDCMKEDIFLCNNGFRHVEWCKMDVCNKILRWNASWNFEGGDVHGKAHVAGGIIDIGSYTQCQASFMIFKVNQHTRDFVKEWLLWCQMPGMIDDSPSKIANYPTFREHRYDQAILTCMAIRDHIPLHWFPSTMNMHRLDMKIPGDDYPAILEHHRRRNPRSGTDDIEWTESEMKEHL